MNKIRVGDTVLVRTGKDKGRTGEVLSLLGNGRLVVSDVNRLKHFERANPQANKPGGIIEREGSIHISNVMLVNAATKRGDRVGVKRLEDGKRVRYFKSNDEVVE